MKSNAMDTEEERATRDFGKSSDESSKTKVKVESEFSEEFYVAVGQHQGFVLSPLLFVIVVNVVTENAREGLMKEVWYANDLVLISETMEGLKERFLK